MFHATYNGENLLGTYFLREPIAFPVLVYLPDPPMAIYPTAVLGGDWIFRGRDFKNLDMIKIP